MKKIVIIVAILGLIGLVYGSFLYLKPTANLQHATPAYSLSAIELFSDYEKDETAANTKYLDKVLQVSGIIESVAENDDGILTITLDANNDLSGVICQLENHNTTYKAGDSITLKGLCSGMLMDVVLVRCVAIKTS